MSNTTNIVLLGIGGQGTLTMMEMLALAAEEAGEEVRVLSRVSLARLGGSGMCHVRLGPTASPAIPVGEADILLALEMSEVLRALPMARKGAVAFINTYRRLPIAAGVAGIHYPARPEVALTLKEVGVTGIFVPAKIKTAIVASISSCSASSVDIRNFCHGLPSNTLSPIVYLALLSKTCAHSQQVGVSRKR
jgi:Pyruvate/2-oxoacid:ferredoxin oxidoreductase gamma subunit